MQVIIRTVMQHEMRYNPETGKVEAFQPVEVDREEYTQNLAGAEAELSNADNQVAVLQHQYDELVVLADTKAGELDTAIESQEAAQERVAFCRGGVEAYDAAMAACDADGDGDEGEVSEDGAGDPVTGATAEVVAAEFDDSDEDEEDEIIESTAQPIAVRTKASI